MDVVTALGQAGIRCAAFVGRNDPARYSRFVDRAFDAMDSWREPDAYVERLRAWGVAQSTPPVLYYSTDADLLMVSRHRETLETAFKFAIPDAELVEDLVDKKRFVQLSGRLGLRVPWSAYLPSDREPGPGDVVSYPVIVKPVVHRGCTALMPRFAKAVAATGLEELREVWRRAASSGVDCIVQQLVPGPESSIESYHTYVDRDRKTVAEFTGVKIRTYPAEYGQSTAVMVTRRDDVLTEGREVVSAIGLAHGVAKVDFKRDPEGRLWLLEVNPRFNLWNNPGALAGANLPALVYADLTGRPRPPIRPMRDGVTWCTIPGDRRAVAAAGMSFVSHLLFIAGSHSRRSGSWSDPMPVLRGHLLPAIRGRIGGPNR